MSLTRDISKPAERERVVLPRDWSFDLANDMVDTIHDEFDPHDAVKELAGQIEGKGAGDAEAAAEAFFADYGKRLMERTLELGDQYKDRTYEVLEEAVEATGGEMGFPLVPERFVEIAYLSTQPIYSLPIAENTRHAFSFKMVFCDTITAMRENCGDELAEKLPCRKACLAATELAFTAKGYPVDVVQESTMVDGDFCQFTATPKEE